MGLPRLHLGLKVLILFFLISILPLILSNVIWFSTTSPPKTTSLIITTVFLITLAIIVVVNLWLAYQITKPIDKLQQGAKLFGQGNLSSRINIKTGDEIEDLADEFNRMAQALEQNIAQLNSQNKLLQVLYENIKRDKEILSAERNKLSIALSSIIDAVLVMDLNRRVIIFNKAAEKIIGLPSDAILGKPLEQLIQVYEKNWPVPIDVFCPVRTDKFEGVIYKKDNLKLVTRPQLQYTKTGECFVNLTCSKITEGPQVNVACILTLHDVTRERELEEMKLDFVSMAAHELRTPLTSLKGYIHVFSKSFNNALTDQQKTYLLRMNIASQRLIGLVENLLNVSRIERGSLTLRLEEVDWLANVKEIVSELLDQAKDKKQELNITLPVTPLPKVKIDKFRINEVLSNLLSNAISYTPLGGKITIWFDVTPNEVITHIKDNGQGIPKDAMLHLFTKFFRVSGVLEQGSKGTGLGLYIAKSIVQLHKGKIWVESEVGKGSTFSFSVPTKESVIDQANKLQPGQVYIGPL